MTTHTSEHGFSFFPAILTGSPEVAQEQLDRLQDEKLHELGVVAVQMDIIDGHFAEAVTLSPLDLVELEFHGWQCDLHLMVDEPLDYVYEAVSVKQQLPIRAVIAQVEHMSYQGSFLEEVRQQGWKPGLSLDLYTPVEAIDEESWQQVKVIQVMGNKAGIQGQQLHQNTFEVVKEVAAEVKTRGLDIEILVDIGVNPTTVKNLRTAGATGGAMGSVIWKSASIEETLESLVAEVKTT